MIYITGDTHRNFDRVERLCAGNKTSLNDMIIILGDAGINYFLDRRDYLVKKEISRYPITIMCIHGNHEERPQNLINYKTKMSNDGIVYYEEEFPNLLFAQDGEIYTFNNNRTLVIGGAYSVDKYYRLLWGYPWFESEQPNELTKQKVRDNLQRCRNRVDIIMSHTCPYKYIPTEMFLDSIDQSTVDNSTEQFLDEIENMTDYQKWYCGHYHTDKEIDKIEFMFKKIKVLK